MLQRCSSALKSRTPYDILGVTAGAVYSAKELKEAFHSKARTCHPDAGGTDVQFQELKAAYERLLQDHSDLSCQDWQSSDSSQLFYGQSGPRYHHCGAAEQRAMRYRPTGSRTSFQEEDRNRFSNDGVPLSSQDLLESKARQFSELLWLIIIYSGVLYFFWLRS